MVTEKSIGQTKHTDEFYALPKINLRLFPGENKKKRE